MATRPDSRTNRQTCSTGTSDTSSLELVVVIRCNGNWLSSPQATDSIIGCRRVSGSSTSSSGRACGSSLMLPLACSSVENIPSKISRMLRLLGSATIRLMLSRERHAC
ncbi:hypothetical protein D3C76_1432950 [compost metagenome]